MSRVGKVPVQIPSGVQVELKGSSLTIHGTKGELNVNVLPDTSVEVKDDQVIVTAAKKATNTANQGLVRTLIENAVMGVTEGFEKRLRIEGVGYRANISGKNIKLELGFSHPIEYTLPEGVEANIAENVLTVSGIDKQLVGQVAANIRAYRKPEPYKGKGIRYENEQVKRKAGKTAAGGAGAGAA
ncbi:MAG: 50S ribosomal protein L6 [Candidatus Saccharimonadales bacterium]